MMTLHLKSALALIGSDAIMTSGPVKPCYFYTVRELANPWDRRIKNHGNWYRRMQHGQLCYYYARVLHGVLIFILTSHIPKPVSTKSGKC